MQKRKEEWENQTSVTSASHRTTAMMTWRIHTSATWKYTAPYDWSLLMKRRLNVNEHWVVWHPSQWHAHMGPAGTRGSIYIINCVLLPPSVKYGGHALATDLCNKIHISSNETVVSMPEWGQLCEAVRAGYDTWSKENKYEIFLVMTDFDACPWQAVFLCWYVFCFKASDCLCGKMATIWHIILTVWHISTPNSTCSGKFHLKCTRTMT